MAFLLLFTIMGYAQEDYSRGERVPLVTDRPDQTESSVTVPLHYLQLELGASFTKDQPAATAQQELSLGMPHLLVRYGLFERFELRLGVEHSLAMLTNLENQVISREFRLAPLLAGTKFKINDQRGWLPEMALLTHLSVPVTQTNTQSVMPEMILAASHEVVPEIGLGYNLGMRWEEQEAGMVFYAFVAGYGVTERTGLFVESFGQLSPVFETSLDGGVTYLVIPNLQLDLSGGMALTPGMPDFFVSAGITYRYPQ